MKALVVGTGTSLDRYDVQYAATKVDLTIAINNAIMMLPNADICYSGSSRWWDFISYVIRHGYCCQHVRSVR